MSLSDPHLTEVAIDELKPRTGEIGRPPVEERMLCDLIHRGMMSDQNYRTWKNNKKRELKSEAQLKKGE